MRRLICVAAVVAATGCGGGTSAGTAADGDGLDLDHAQRTELTPGDAATEAASAPVASAAAWSIQLDPPVRASGTRKLNLTWRTSGGGTGLTYGVWIQTSSRDTYKSIATGLAASPAQVQTPPGWKMDWPTTRVLVRGCNAANQCKDSNSQPLVDVLMASRGELGPDPQTLASTFSYGIALSNDGNTLAVANPTDFPDVEPRPPGIGSIDVFRRASNGSWQREAYLSDFQTEGNFGNPMALSGDGRTLVVGAYTDSGSVGGVNPPPGSGLMWSGAAIVFTRGSQGQWTRQALLKAAQPQEYETFGYRMAISRDGNRLAVYGNKRTHVLARSAGQWRHEALVQHPSPRPDGQAGLMPVIAMSGNGNAFAVTVVVSDLVGGEGFLSYASVQVFGRVQDGVWLQQSDLRSSKPPLTPDDDESFGEALALDHAGTTLAVGAPRDPGDASDTGNDPFNRRSFNAGAVYVFGANAGVWSRTAFVKARGAHAMDQFGREISLTANGQVLLAKACGLAGNATNVRRNHRAGTVIGTQDNDTSCGWGGSGYVLERNGSNGWTHLTSIIPVGTDLISHDFFSIALSGDGQTIALGAQAFYPDGTSKDRVYIY